MTIQMQVPVGHHAKYGSLLRISVNSAETRELFKAQVLEGLFGKGALFDYEDVQLIIALGEHHRFAQLLQDMGRAFAEIGVAVQFVAMEEPDYIQCAQEVLQQRVTRGEPSLGNVNFGGGFSFPS